jgi:hypothetical protein
MKTTRIKTAKKRSSLSRAKIERVVAEAYAKPLPKELEGKEPLPINLVFTNPRAGKLKK